MGLLIPIDHKEDTLGQTRLMWLAQAGGAGSFNAIKRVLDVHFLVYKSDEAITKVDFFGNSILHYTLMHIAKATPQQAREKGKIARYLISLGADPFLENKGGVRPLDYVGQGFGAIFNLPSLPSHKLRSKDYRPRPL